MQLPGISIVIPAYNEEKFLPATLAAVAQTRLHFASRFAFPTEVIVVNNVSTDATEQVALAGQAVVVNHGVRNISAVRNAGIHKAAYTLIVTIDADSFLPEDALYKIWILMDTQRYIGGALGVKLLTDKWFMKSVAFVVQTLVGFISGIQGAMFFFWREAALEIGGFPEERLVAEDSAFALALRAQGRKQGKEFAKLRSVQVGTLDRKEINLRILFPLIGQLLKGFLGVKQTAEDLKYWYNPKR